MPEAFDWPPNPFWEFSIAIYRQPGVAKACIGLQEKHAIDVNLLLYLAWLAIEGGHRIDRTAAADFVRRARAWHDAVVRPLRALRTTMKADRRGAPAKLAERLRAQVKSAELDAERIEQAMLHAARPQAAGSAHGSREIVRANIQAYFEALEIVVDPNDRADIETIINTAIS